LVWGDPRPLFVLTKLGVGVGLVSSGSSSRTTPSNSQHKEGRHPFREKQFVVP